MADSVAEGVKMESTDANQQSGPSRKRHRERSPRRSLACISCRKIKMKCVGGDESTGLPCRVSLMVYGLRNSSFALNKCEPLTLVIIQRCRNHNRECVWVESKRGRRPKGMVPEGGEQPTMDRRPSDSTLSPHTTPERLPPPPGTHSSQPIYNPQFIGTPTSYSSYTTCNHPSGLRNERPEDQSRERRFETPVSPLMEMVDGNESRQLLESRIRLVEREFIRNATDPGKCSILSYLRAEMTGTYSASGEPCFENVVTPAASTPFTNHPSSSDTHPADRRNHRLQSLPSTVLNPLGLLAEASLRGSDEPQSEAPTPRHSPRQIHSQLPGQADATTPDGMRRQHRKSRHLPGVGNARYFEVSFSPASRIARHLTYAGNE
jgi:hypothetical protein